MIVVWIGYVLLCVSIIVLLLESHFTARKEIAKKAALPTKAEPAAEPAVWNSFFKSLRVIDK